MAPTMTLPAAILLLLVAATTAFPSYASRQVAPRIATNEEYFYRGVKLTNAVRIRNRRSWKRRGAILSFQGDGSGNLIPGTQSMLYNAVSHSKSMAERFSPVPPYSELFHQTLLDASAEIGCGLVVVGELVHYYHQDLVRGDPVVVCTRHWEEKNLDFIMRQPEGASVAVGVYNDGTRWWCTQVFAMKYEEVFGRAANPAVSDASADPSQSCGAVALPVATD